MCERPLVGSACARRERATLPPRAELGPGELTLRAFPLRPRRGDTFDRFPPSKLMQLAKDAAEVPTPVLGHFAILVVGARRRNNPGPRMSIKLASYSYSISASITDFAQNVSLGQIDHAEFESEVRFDLEGDLQGQSIPRIRIQHGRFDQTAYSEPNR